MVKMFCYAVVYANGKRIQHYNVEQLCDMLNKYNDANQIKHRFNVNKIHRYSSYSAIPTYYQAFEKIPLAEYLGVQNLSMVNYRKIFDAVAE
jgi:hypothetical protein